MVEMSKKSGGGRTVDADDDSLGTVVIILLYACVWSGARDDAVEWVNASGSEDDLSAMRVAIEVVCVMFSAWAWLLLLVAVLFLVQTYVIANIRTVPGGGRSAFGISFSSLTQTTVLASLFACIVATFVFAFVGALRILNAHERNRHSRGRSDENGQRVSRRKASLRLLVSNAMLFNLVIVAITLFLGCSSGGAGASAASSSQKPSHRGRG